MFFLYRFATALLLPVYLLISLFRRTLSFQELRERLGMLEKNEKRGQLIWIHGASVGEMSACIALVKEINEMFPRAGVAVSTMTRAGKKVAQEKIPGAKQVFLAPLDSFYCVRSAMRRISPDSLIILETELWPNLLHEAKRCGVPLAIANGTVSRKSFRRYLLFRSIFRRLLSSFLAVGVQTDDDAERFINLGVPRERVRVLGNMKEDLIEPRKVSDDERTKIRERLGIDPGRKILVAGSTRPGEEEEIVFAFKKVREEFLDALLILAPRHMKRLGDVERMLSREMLTVRRRTSLAQEPQSFQIPGWSAASSLTRQLQQPGIMLRQAVSIILVDTIGELKDFYSAADVSFVGGTLKPFGGHNVLEPAAFGVPVSFGPHFEKCKEGALALLESEGGRVVRSGLELGEVWLRWLSDNDERERTGNLAIQAVLQRKGASKRTVSFLCEKGVFR